MSTVICNSLWNVIPCRNINELVLACVQDDDRHQEDGSVSLTENFVLLENQSHRHFKLSVPNSWLNHHTEEKSAQLLCLLRNMKHPTSLTHKHALWDTGHTFFVKTLIRLWCYYLLFASLRQGKVFSHWVSRALHTLRYQVWISTVSVRTLGFFSFPGTVLKPSGHPRSLPFSSV